MPRRIPLSRTAAVAAAGLAALLAGCMASPHGHGGWKVYVHPTLASHPPARVVFLPLYNETDFPNMEEGLAEELCRAIQRRHLFHLEMPVQPLQDEGALPALNAKTFTLKEVAEMRRALGGADAVLIGGVNRAQPFPRMRVGLCLRLLDLRNARLLWAVGGGCDATDQRTQRCIETFFKRELGSGAEPFEWQLATVSPRAFQKFVAWEVAGTLPRRIRGSARTSGQLRASANFRKKP